MRYDDIPFSHPTPRATARASRRVKPPKFDWSEENIERLRQLWAEGHSTSAIGRMMGCSKNVVVGKAHRLGLPSRPSPIVRGGSPKATPPRADRRRALSEAIPVGLTAPRMDRPVRLSMGRGEGCRFPIGMPKEPGFRFCDAPPMEGSSYCPECHAVCYRPAKPMALPEGRLSYPDYVAPRPFMRAGVSN